MKPFEQIPFNPARWPFFYGWMIMLWGVFGVILSAPGQTTGVSAFIEPLIESLGISRIDLSLAYMIGTLTSATLLTPAGKLFDRIGARWMGFGSCMALGMVLLLLSRTAHLHRWLASYLSARESLIALLALLFFMLRFSGQGVLTMSSRNMVMKWFDQHRGLASGISGAAVSFAFSYAPSIFSGLIGVHGWSATWLLIGCVILLGCSPLVLLFFRDNPEESGLVPDGTPHPGGERKTAKVHRQYTLAEARSTYAFWPFVLALSLQGLIITAATFNIESIFIGAGMEGARGFALFPPTALIAIAINLIGGWVSDRMELRWLLAAMLGAMAVQLTALMLLAPGWPVATVILFGGIGNGLFGILMNVVWPRYYGREHLGAISGLSMTFMVVASAIGPISFSVLLRLTGNYAGSFAVCLAAALILLAGSFFARNPQQNN
jgi:MFS family permease